MRKRDSRRRWKARLMLGKWVPLTAVVEHGLTPLAALEVDERRFVRLKVA